MSTEIETLEIKTTKEKFFLEYLILKKPVIDRYLWELNGKKKTTLSEKPMQVLAQFLYFNDQYKEFSEVERWQKVFSREVKEMICGRLEIPEHHLNIQISKLRSIGIMNGKKIRSLFVIYADDRTLTFTFRLNGHAK